MKKSLYTVFFFLLLFCSFTSLNGQQIDQSNQIILKSLNDVEMVVMPSLNNDELYQAELNRRAPGVAPHFAENIEVVISPETHGEWEMYENGVEVWRLRIHSKGAKSLNLGFSKYDMPDGGSMFLYPMNQVQDFIGPFTIHDNDEHEQLWTPIVDGDEMVIEVQVPFKKRSKLKLELSYVNHDYIGFSNMSAISGSCNLDVVCGSEDGWDIVDGYRDIIRSVGVISLGGGTFCTGFLVNNANQDCTPFFMTANHCGISANNAASLVSYWNFENSTCRQPGSAESGQNGDGQLSQFNTGAVHRASYAPSDFTLVEFDDPIDENANAFLAGWSNEFIMPQDTVICVHHPATDEKRISFEFDPTTPSTGGNNVVDINVATHVRIADWDIGTTEGGSSGSPLFNSNKQVVGQLQGGLAACGNDLFDVYGWFNTSWNGGGTTNSALRFWLDPNNTGIESIDGRECSQVINTDVLNSEICGLTDVVYNLTISESFEADVDLSAINLADGLTAMFDPNPVSPGGISVLTITNTSTELEGPFQIMVQGNDGTNDANVLMSLEIFQETPEMLNQIEPSDLAMGTVVTPTLSWDAPEMNATFTVQISLADDFSMVELEQTGIEATQFTSTPLAASTTYYWRVRGENICGEGEWSSIRSFTTANCINEAATDIPIEIEAPNASSITSVITVSLNGIINDVNVVNLDIPHTYVGDLSARLRSPSGTVVELFDRPGQPEIDNFGCDEANILASFDDDAANTASDFEDSCSPSGIAISGTFQSLEMLSAFNGEESIGNWELTITDNVGADGGSLEGWALEFCTETNFNNSTLVATESVVDLCTGDEINFNLEIGDGFADTGVNLSAEGLPDGAEVNFGSNPVNPGDIVQVSISNLSLSGEFDITFTADDGTNSDQAIVVLDIRQTLAPTVLQFPENEAIDIVLMPTFEWEDLDGALTYRLKVATDEALTNLEIEATSVNNSFTFGLPLDANTTHYWQVEALNFCGSSFTEINSFTTEMVTSTNEWERNQFSLTPNPSNGVFVLNHQNPLSIDEVVEVYSIDGKLIKNYKVNAGNSSIQIDLTGYETGVYLLKVESQQGVMTRKLVLQK